MRRRGRVRDAGGARLVLAEETYLQDRLAEVDAEIDVMTAPLKQKRASLEAALAALRHSADGETRKLKVSKEDQGPSGLEIMLRHMPASGLSLPELEALLQEHSVSKSKKEGMIAVSIQTNLRLKNLELRNSRYYLTEKAKTGRTAKLLQ